MTELNVSSVTHHILKIGFPGTMATVFGVYTFCEINGTLINFSNRKTHETDDETLTFDFSDRRRPLGGDRDAMASFLSFE